MSFKRQVSLINLVDEETMTATVVDFLAE